MKQIRPVRVCPMPGGSDLEALWSYFLHTVKQASHPFLCFGGRDPILHPHLDLQNHLSVTCCTLSLRWATISVNFNTSKTYCSFPPEPWLPILSPWVTNSTFPSKIFLTFPSSLFLFCSTSSSTLLLFPPHALGARLTLRRYHLNCAFFSSSLLFDPSI